MLCFHFTSIELTKIYKTFQFVQLLQNLTLKIIRDDCCCIEVIQFNNIVAIYNLSTATDYKMQLIFIIMHIVAFIVFSLQLSKFCVFEWVLGTFFKI